MLRSRLNLEPRTADTSPPQPPSRAPVRAGHVFDPATSEPTAPEPTAPERAAAWPGYTQRFRRSGWPAAWVRRRTARRPLIAQSTWLATQPRVRAQPREPTEPATQPRQSRHASTPSTYTSPRPRRTHHRDRQLPRWDTRMLLVSNISWVYETPDTWWQHRACLTGGHEFPRTSSDGGSPWSIAGVRALLCWSGCGDHDLWLWAGRGCFVPGDGASVRCCADHH